jgi:hypothetical protein
MLTEIGRALGEMPDTLFRSVLLPDGKPLTPATLPQLDFNVVLHRLSEQLAQRGDDAIGPEAKYPATIQAVVKFIEGFAKKQAAELAQWVLGSSDPPGQRLIRAEKAAAAVSKRLSAMHDDSREQRRQLQDSLAKFEQLLGVGQMPAGNRLPPIRKLPQEYEAHFLEYCRLRMFNVALFFIQDLARRVKNLLTPMHDQLGDARRDLKGLIATLTPAELAESAGSELDEQLRQALLHEFATHRTALTQELDHWLQDTLFQKAGGFLTVLGKGGDHRTQFVSQLFHAARLSVLRSLQRLDVANFLMQSSADGGSIRLAGSLESARPKPLADATCRTLIAVSQSSTNTECRELLVSAVQEQSGIKPAVVGYGESDVTIISELAGLPIADVAVRLIDERADFIEYAKRVFSRGDIPFEPLTLKEEKEEAEAASA